MWKDEHFFARKLVFTISLGSWLISIWELIGSLSSYTSMILRLLSDWLVHFGLFPDVLDAPSQKRMAERRPGIGFELAKWGFPQIGVPPNHPILVGLSLINHPFWGNRHVCKSQKQKLVSHPTGAFGNWHAPRSSCRLERVLSSGRQSPMAGLESGAAKFDPTREGKLSWLK